MLKDAYGNYVNLLKIGYLKTFFCSWLKLENLNLLNIK
jgi:hypothetical protein